MTVFNIDGVEYTSTKVPLWLGCEAEKMLKVQLTDGFFAMKMIELYVAMRQAEPETPAFIHADKVKAADFLTMETDEPEEAAEVPLDEPETEEEDTPPDQESAGPTGHQTSGIPVSASSG